MEKIIMVKDEECYLINDNKIFELMLNEIRSAVDAKLYLTALSMSLTIPDICGKAEYPNYKNGKRYTQWFDTYSAKYANKSDVKLLKNKELQYLNGGVLYSLRNQYLHSGIPNTEREKNGITEFTLAMGYLENCAHTPQAATYSSNYYGKPRTTYNIDIRELCTFLCNIGELYYDDNKSKFNFFEYKLLDWGKWRIAVNKLKEDI